MLRYFIELRKNIFFLKEDQGGPPVTLNDILKKSIFHSSTDKIRKTYEKNKKFPVQKVTQEHLRLIISTDGSSKTTPVG